MTRGPHDLADLYLAPVVLAVERRIEHLGRLDDEQLAREVAAVSELPTRDVAERRSALLIAIGAVVELHGWTLSWDDTRGVRVAHGPHSIVIGVPAAVRRFTGSDLPAESYR